MPQLIADGARLFYDTAGAEGPPVLLIQGVGCLGEAWRPQIDGLRGAHRLAWFDNRGIGASEAGARPLTIAQLARDAVAVLDHLGWESAHLVGHSMGGVIAQQAALDAPGRVRSLVLASTLYRGRDVMRMQLRSLWPMLRSQLGTAAWRRSGFCDLAFPKVWQAQVGRAALLERLPRIYGRDVGVSLPIVSHQLAALRGSDLSPRLGAITQPTLVITGPEDLVINPRQSDELAARIPGARLATIAGAGHGVTVQCADEVNALVAEHVARAEAARPA